MTSTPHDSLVRAVFGQPEHAAGLLRSILPAEVARRLDWSRLKVVSGTLVDPELCQRHSDLLFQVPLAGRDAFVHVLIEHQSGPDRLMPFRLLRYEVPIWDQWLERNPGCSRLPVIIPVVLYHGETAWRHSTQLADLFDLDPALRSALGQQIPRQCFRLEDLSEYPDEELRGRSISALGRLTLLSLKHARHSRDLTARLVASAALFREVLAAPHGLEALARVVRYNLMVSDHVEHEELAELMSREVTEDVGEIVMTTGEKLIERGRKEGILLGKREVLLSLIHARFGEPADEICQRVQEASRADLETWIEQILHAETVDDVFRP